MQRLEFCTLSRLGMLLLHNSSGSVSVCSKTVSPAIITLLPECTVRVGCQSFEEAGYCFKNYIILSFEHILSLWKQEDLRGDSTGNWEVQLVCTKVMSMNHGTS